MNPSAVPHPPSTPTTPTTGTGCTRSCAPARCHRQTQVKNPPHHSPATSTPCCGAFPPTCNTSEALPARRLRWAGGRAGRHRMLPASADDLYHFGTDAVNRPTSRRTDASCRTRSDGPPNRWSGAHQVDQGLRSPLQHGRLDPHDRPGHQTLPATTSVGGAVTTFVPLLTKEQIEALPARAREVVEYRKSGLSLNHVQGCPLDCAYCIRHTYGVWDMRQPRALMDDASAVRALVEHPYFQPDVTPIQVFNRATDPMLPRVKNHLFAVLADLDARGLRNHVLIITRYRVTAQDCQRLNELRNVKLTLLFTYSGIDDKRIEPYPSDVAATSLRLASALAGRYRTILYWRPLVPGLNDTPQHLRDAVQLGAVAHSTVFTGLFYRDEIAAYYRDNGLPEPYDETARRKIVPETILRRERRVLDAFAD